jgi:hypothetical protein
MTVFRSETVKGVDGFVAGEWAAVVGNDKLQVARAQLFHETEFWLQFCGNPHLDQCLMASLAVGSFGEAAGVSPCETADDAQTAPDEFVRSCYDGCDEVADFEDGENVVDR